MGQTPERSEERSEHDDTPPRRRGGLLRGLFWLVIGVVVLVALAAVLLFVFRRPVAEAGLRQILTDYGFAPVEVTVSALGAKGLELRDVRLGDDGGREALSLDRVALVYDLEELFAGRLQTVEIEGLEIAAEVSETGAVRLPLLDDFEAPETETSGSFELPLKALSARDLTLRLTTPYGEVSATGEAKYTELGGGTASFAAAPMTVESTLGALRLDGLSGEAALAKDGAVEGALALSLGLGAETWQAEDVTATLSFKGDTPSYRTGEFADADLTFDFKAEAEGLRCLGGLADCAPDLASALDVAPETPFAPFIDDVRATLAGAVEGARAEFRAEGHYKDQRAWIAAAEESEPFGVITTDAAMLSIRTSVADTEFFDADGRAMTPPVIQLFADRIELSAIAHLSADRMPETVVTLSGRYETGAPLDGVEGSASLEFNDWRSGGQELSLASLSSDFSGNSEYLQVLSDLTFAAAGEVAPGLNADISPDSPFAGKVRADLNFVNKTADITILTPPEPARGGAGRPECLGGRVSVKMTDLLSSRLAGASVCGPESGSAATVSWVDGFTLSSNFLVEPGAFDLTVGEQSLAGEAPRIPLTVDYDQATERLSVEFELKDGVITAPDVAEMRNLEAKGALNLDGGMVQANLALDRLHVLDPATPSRFAPLKVTGALALTGDDATFNARAFDYADHALGYVEGVHNLANGEGRASYNSGGLIFAPRGLQPQNLAPLLKSYVQNVQGTVEASAEASWAGEDVKASARAGLYGLNVDSAIGPISGVNGDIAFTDVFGPKTDGVQSLSIGSVDVGIILEGGEIEYEITPEGGVHIARAEWPWAGGQLGVFDARASLVDGRVDLPFEVRNIYLEPAFELLNIQGLSGEGVIAGEFPVVIEGDRVRIENGYLGTEQPGVIRYSGPLSDAAVAAAPDAIVFEALQDFHYDRMSVKLDGYLDEDVYVDVNLVGNNPLVYYGHEIDLNINVEAPLTGLLRQSKLSTDWCQQLQQVGKEFALCEE